MTTILMKCSAWAWDWRDVLDTRYRTKFMFRFIDPDLIATQYNTAYLPHDLSFSDPSLPYLTD
jgi:hypothetical protein